MRFVLALIENPSVPADIPNSRHVNRVVTLSTSAYRFGNRDRVEGGLPSQHVTSMQEDRGCVGRHNADHILAATSSAVTVSICFSHLTIGQFHIVNTLRVGPLMR